MQKTFPLPMQTLKNQNNTYDNIPFPDLTHPFFNRSKLPVIRKSPEFIPARHLLFNSIISRIFKFFRIDSPTFRWAMFRVFMGFARTYFRIINRLSIKGRKSVPNRAIFYINHPGSLDPLLFLAAMGEPVGCFVGYDNYWFIHALEVFYGFINRIGSRDELIERMIRNMIKKNKYFAIWPEGTLSKKGMVMQGFSSIIRAYATLNCEKNLVPLVPVVLKGSECYNYQFAPRPQSKIEIEFLDSFYLPREWFNQTSPQAKSPREIIDYLMNILAKAKGQKKFIPNFRLENRKKKFQN